jgi:hypothetical protein
MANLSGSMEKDPAPFAMPGAIHQGVGHASMAEEIPLFARSMEHEGMVGKLHNRQFPRVHHELERLDPRTCPMRRHLHASIGDAHSNLAAAASDFALGQSVLYDMYQWIPVVWGYPASYGYYALRSEPGFYRRPYYGY